jgi:hypothetical protein
LQEEVRKAMRILWLVCKSCGSPFESGVPLCREILEGVKLRALEVCPVCGARSDYEGADYREPDAAPRPSPQDTSAAQTPAAQEDPAEGAPSVSRAPLRERATPA